MMQEFVDQINKSARSATEDMHTALPGEIKSYDPDKGVATVLPKAKFTKPDGSMMDFPEISGVPVMFPQSKNVTIAWPIKKGDKQKCRLDPEGSGRKEYGSVVEAEGHRPR